MRQEDMRTRDEIISGAVATIIQVDPAITQQDDWDAVRDETVRQAPRSEVDGW